MKRRDAGWPACARRDATSGTGSQQLPAGRRATHASPARARRRRRRRPAASASRRASWRGRVPSGARRRDRGQSSHRTRGPPATVRARPRAGQSRCRPCSRRRRSRRSWHRRARRGGGHRRPRRSANGSHVRWAIPRTPQRRRECKRQSTHSPSSAARRVRRRTQIASSSTAAVPVRSATPCRSIRDSAVPSSRCSTKSRGLA